MAALGGVIAFSVLGSQQLDLPELYRILIVAIPISILLGFFSAKSIALRGIYILSALFILGTVGAGVYFGLIPKWFMYAVSLTVFLAQWVTLFRWRYVVSASN